MKKLDPLNVKYFKLVIPPQNLGKETSCDIAAKCIICGDSKRFPNKKRLHLYTKPNYRNDVIKCFNCNFSGSMYQFLKEVRPDLLNIYLKEKRSRSFNNLNSFKDPNLESLEKFSKNLEDIKNIENIEVFQKPKLLFDLPKEFKLLKNSDQKFKDYIYSRNINFNDDIYSCDTEVNINNKNLKFYNSIIIPLWFNKSKKIIYGFQSRRIDQKRFYTYLPEENSSFRVWNWFQINKNKTIYIFESFFDAKSSGIPNDQIIAALGSSISIERLSELTDYVFCLDNQFRDLTSKKKSLNLLKQNKKVFIWPKDLNLRVKDVNELSLTLPKKEISNIIYNNIFDGMKGILKLKLS